MNLNESTAQPNAQVNRNESTTKTTFIILVTISLCYITLSTSDPASPQHRPLTPHRPKPQSGNVPIYFPNPIIFSIPTTHPHLIYFRNANGNHNPQDSFVSFVPFVWISSLRSFNSFFISSLKSASTCRICTICGCSCCCGCCCGCSCTSSSIRSRSASAAWSASLFRVTVSFDHKQLQKK